MKRKFILLFLSILVSFSISSCDDMTGESGAISEESEISAKDESESAVGYESAELSAELFDFSVKIDGVDYKLPAMQTAFTKNGWNISPNTESVVKASFKADATLSKGDVIFDVQVINSTKAELTFEECPIGKISYDFSGNAEIYIADGFLLNGASKTSIVEKYGEPETTETHNDFSEIIYGSRKTSGNYAKYLFRFDKNGKIIYFSITNFYMPN